MNNYFKRGALLLGLAALATVGAKAEWVQFNGLQNPAFIPGWHGALTAVNWEVGESFNGPFEIYQIVDDAPAGEYTLTVNAFYRYSNNDDSQANMKNGANHNAYIFLGANKQTVEGLFDKEADMHPNGLDQAVEAFNAGRYINKVTYNHPGGVLRLGIANTGGRTDEWCAFDNFKLVGPNGEVALVNADFSTQSEKAKENNGFDFNSVWNCDNIAGSAKTPDVNKAGGVYRKTNASPYNFGQEVELPAGKYRFGVQSFLRYGGAGNVSGKYITCKGEWGWTEDESALDRHNNNTEDPKHNAYIYVTSGWDTDDDGNHVKPVEEEYALDPEFGNPAGFYTEKPIMCMFDEDLDVYPDNEPNTAEGTPEGYGWCDSGFEYQAAALFVKNPNLYRNYVEFELTAPSKVWVGLKKDVNAPTQYWNPFRDFTIEKWAESASIGSIEADENAPVEYYNMQGMRVDNPANGIFIVKQGKKVTKQVIR